MDMNNVNIEEIVKQVLSGMTGNAPAATAAPAASTGIPKTARVAVLTEKEHFELKEYPIPPLGDDDILATCKFTRHKRIVRNGRQVDRS